MTQIMSDLWPTYTHCRLMSMYNISHVRQDYAEITTTALPYQFDNRTGKFSVWNLSLFLDGAEMKMRESGMKMPFTSDSTSSLIMIKLVMKIVPSVYELNFLNPTNLMITKQLNEPESSTFSVTTKLLDGKSGDVLVERFAKYGRINIDTRKLIKLDTQEFLDKFPHLRGKKTPTELKRSTIPSAPPHGFEMPVKVRYSDLDTKYHANQSFYIKSSIDCATEASNKGLLKSFTGDLIWYPIKDIHINYLAEGFVNDDVKITVWQDSNQDNILHFIVKRDRDQSQLAYIVAEFSMVKIPNEYIFYKS